MAKRIARPVRRTGTQVAGGGFLATGLLLIWPHMRPELAVWIGQALTLTWCWAQNLIEARTGKDWL